MNSETLRFVIKAKDEASSTLRGVGGGFGKLKMIAVAAFAAIAAAIVAALAVMLNWGKVVDDAYDSIRIGTGKTGAALKGLQDDFKAVFRTVPADAATVSTAIATLNQRLGLTGKPLQSLAKDFVNLARLLKLDVGTAIAETTRLFGDWSIKGISAQREAMNALFRTTQQTGIGYDTLTQTVVQFGAPLRNLGFTFAESTAMLGKWEKEGVNITTVLAGMRFALKRFAAEGIDPQKGLAQAIDDIAKAKSRAAAMKLGGDIFGLRGASDVVAAIREGRFQYEDLMKSVAGGSDTIAKAAKDTDDWKEKLIILKNRAMVYLEPALMGLMDGITSLADGIGKLAGNKDVQGFFAGIVGGVRQTADFIRAHWGQIAGTASTVWAQVSDTFAKVAAIVGPVIADIVATVRQYWPQISAVVKATMNSMLAIVKVVWPMVKNYILGALNIIAGAIRLVLALIRGDWSGAWNGIKQILRGAWQVILALVKGSSGLMLLALKTAWSLMKAAAAAAFRGLVSAAKAGLGALISFVRGVPGRIKSALGNLGSLLYEAGKSIISGLINGIKDKLSDLWGEVSSIAGKIKDIKGPLGKDAVLLRPAGQAIIGGLMAGIADQLGPLYKQVGGIAAGLAVNAAPSMSPAGPVAAAPSLAGIGGGTTIAIDARGAVFAQDAAEVISDLAERGYVVKMRRAARTSGAFA